MGSLLNYKTILRTLRLQVISYTQLAFILEKYKSAYVQKTL